MSRKRNRLNDRKCEICNNKKQENVSMFRFPVDEERCKLWLDKIKKEALRLLNKNQFSHRFVCASHFEEHCFTSSLKNRISKFAVPSLHLLPEHNLEHPIKECKYDVTNKENNVGVSMQLTDLTTKKIDNEIHFSSKSYAQIYEDHCYVKTNSVGINQFDHLRSRSAENLLENKSANKKDDIGNKQNNQIRKKILKLTKEDFHRCNRCSKKFLSLINLFVHKYKFCKARLTRISLLKLKLSLKRKYQCNLCERNFLNESYLKWHLFTHIGKRPFSCKVCFKSFYVNSYLQNHEKVHTEENIFQNKACERNLNFGSYLDVYREHNGENELFYCQICKKTFRTETTLIRHGISHSKEKFHCDICNKDFQYKLTYERHQASHSKETSFQCSFCEKTFKIHSKLTTHLRIHSQYKTFQCKVCQKKFKQISKLKKHEKCHSKYFKCVVCKKNFDTRLKLASHQRTHSVQKHSHCRFCM